MSVVPPVRSLLLFAVAAGVGALVGACGGNGGESADATVVEPRLLQTETGERIFAGTLVNQGSAPIGIAEVEVALYDDQGSRIETMRIQVQDVSPGDSATFNQTVDSNRPIQQAQVQNILSP
ncbi:FxLYD domain-containing protein [Salinibacter altiplanensis]|uniref:FxLYD domain-containing protein n=1 Tax=Salinibacter altiplanensis TaxID=1803181 RepID=UPI001F229B65|nr:FxLYD domain-containing protein [Salinibacter altiplanensis]